MKKSLNIFTTITTTLACLAVFLVIFQSKIVAPAIMQSIGRLHPLFVHFPVTLFLVVFIYFLLFSKHIHPENTRKIIGDWLLLITAFSCVISVIAGTLLSTEGGYDPETINWHKWMGVLFMFFMLLWYSLKDKVNYKRLFTNVFCIAGFGLNLAAGHLGANITHGEDYIYAPLLKDKKQEAVALEDAMVYQHMVRPILEAKCISCHSSKKAKGNLVMETEAMLLKGGKSGSLWDLKEADLGLMLRRVHLPEDQKKHMPPVGKPQLTDNEIAILTEWIKKGSDFKLKVAGLDPADSLYLLAKDVFKSGAEEVYDFAAADEKKIESLNAQNLVIKPVALESPALDVSFFGASLYKPEQLNALADIKQQVVSLSLEKMPLQPDALKTITQFSNLRKLNLSFTPVKTNELPQLSKLTKLKTIALAGVKLSANDLKAICMLPAIKEIFLWNSGLDSNTVATIQNNFKKIKIDKGFDGNAIVMQLNAPILLNEERVIRDTMGIKLKHYINGVTIRYTLDGSDPDSLASPIYNGRLVLDKNCMLKAKAFKPGWLSSDIIETYFFRNNHVADTAIALTPPDPSYKAQGGQTLVDGVKGDNNFRSGKWLGYKENKMEVEISYRQPYEISSVTLSTIVDIGSYIFPVQNLVVYGGTSKNNMKMLGQVAPPQPVKQVALYQKGIEVKFSPQTVQYLKVVAIPVNRIPDWHQGKGQKGWVFADEVFVN